MVSLKSKNLLLALTALFLLPHVVMAAGVLEWKVESTRKKMERPPAYAAGERTPFPVKARPIVIEKVKDDADVLSESQIKAMEAADLLNEIRDILTRDNIFSVDVSNLVVDGVLFGDEGNSVLVKNIWYNEGDVIDVPAMARESLLALLVELEALDPAVAEVVAAQVESKLDSVKSLTLRILSVSKDNVMMMDDNDETHVISFKHSGF